MELLMLGRAEGKTTAAIGALTRNPNAVLVCFSAEEAARLHHDYPTQKDKILSIQRVLDGSLRGRKVTIIIDNLDMMLRYLFGANDIELVTWTR